MPHLRDGFIVANVSIERSETVLERIRYWHGVCLGGVILSEAAHVLIVSSSV